MSSPSSNVTTYRAADALQSLEKVVIDGNLATLTPGERVAFYARVCESVGLNPLTRPFEYLTLEGRLTLYARKDATDQLRHIHGISIDRLDRETSDDMETVTAYGRNRHGRTDSSIGVVWVRGQTGQALANARMRAETKAKRRLTLSLAGLGWLDESEVVDVTEQPAGPSVATRVEQVRSRVERLTGSAPDQAGSPEGATEASANTPDSPPSTQDTVLDLDEVPGGFSSGPASSESAGDPWLRRLHAMGSERGLDHDALHDLAVEKMGVGSLTELSIVARAQFMNMVEDMEQVAVVSSPPGDAVTAGEAGVTSGLPQATPAASSVGLPLSKDAFQVWAAAALGIETTGEWSLEDLNQAEADRAIELLGFGEVEYGDWYARCQRPLRAWLMDRHESPRQRRDRAAAAEAKERHDAAAVGTTT